MKARYTHTNIIAEDWKKLAEFYTIVFGCEFVPPERDYSGELIEKATAIPGVHLTGAHLRLPGCSDNGPTIEIYHFNKLASPGVPAINRPGFGHIAFEVDDVYQARQEVLAHGGKPIGEIVTLTTKIGTKVTMCYMTDPEGNAIEIQAWSK